MVWYPNYWNDRILAGYKAEVDLKVGYEMNQILNISKISFYVNDKLTRCSPYIKKEQVAVGLVGASMMVSTLLGPTSETAKFGSGLQTYPTSVVVVNPQSLVMDQANLVKTTERPEVVEVKSGDPQSPLGSVRSGRSNGKLSRPSTPSPQYRSTQVNPYRTPPKIQTGNPGDPGKTEINEGSRREIISREFATPSNFQPPQNRKITEEFDVNDDSDQCLEGDEVNEQRKSILKRLGKKTQITLKNPQAKKDYKSACKLIKEGQPLENIGKGGRYFGHGIGYIRKGDTRIFYEEFVDGVKILGITTKGNNKQANQIARLVNELYPSLDINYKNL